MPFLKNIESGAVTDYLDDDSPEYLILSKMRLTAPATISGSGGFGAGSGGSYTAKAGEPLWEAIAVQDMNVLTASGGGPAKRVVVLYNLGCAKGATTSFATLHNPTTGGKLVSAAYVPLAAMGETPGETNYRTLTLTQTLTEAAANKASPIAKVTFKKTVNSGLLVPTAAALEGTEKILIQASSLENTNLFVVSANGAGEEVDPGGVFYAVYTKE